MSDKMQGAQTGIENGAEKAKGAADWVADKAEGIKETTMGLVDVVQQRAKNVTHAVSDAASRVRDKSGEWLGDAADTVQTAVEDGYGTTHDAVEHFGRDITAVIRKHPMTAVAIGLGLGLLLGRAVSNRA